MDKTSKARPNKVRVNLIKHRESLVVLVSVHCLVDRDILSMIEMTEELEASNNPFEVPITQEEPGRLVAPLPSPPVPPEPQGGAPPSYTNLHG